MTGGVSDLGGIFAKGGHYPITCHVSDSKTSISMPKNQNDAIVSSRGDHW